MHVYMYILQGYRPLNWTSALVWHTSTEGELIYKAKYICLTTTGNDMPPSAC